MAICKAVEFTVDIDIARKALEVAGFNPREIREASDDEIFERVLRMADCYGGTFQLSEQRQGHWVCDYDDQGFWRCSGCGFEALPADDEFTPYELEMNYCEKCGLQMVKK